MTNPNRSPWLIPVLLVAFAAGAFLLIATTRAGTDLKDLLGEWLIHSVLFVVFAVAAVMVYRSLRRHHAPAAMDEARSRDGR